MLNSFFLSRFYQYLQPLDRFYGPDQVNDFVAFARNGMRGPDGKLRALWVNTDVRVLHYRKDLVSDPPKTWDELIAQASDAVEARTDRLSVSRAAAARAP